jgi:hypothetical protein
MGITRKDFIALAAGTAAGCALPPQPGGGGRMSGREEPDASACKGGMDSALPPVNCSMAAKTKEVEDESSNG